MAGTKRLKPRKRPLQERSKETVEIVLKAAGQVFQRQGYAAGTTDRIAERAGVSVGTLYQYFPNKDSILALLAERHIDEGFKLVEAKLAESLTWTTSGLTDAAPPSASGTSVEEKAVSASVSGNATAQRANHSVSVVSIETILRVFVEGLLALHRHEPELHRVLFEDAPLPPGLRRKLMKRQQVFAERVEVLLSAVDAGKARDLRLASYMTVQTIEGLVHDFVLHPPAGIDEEDFVDEVVTMLGGYLSPPHVGIVRKVGV